MTYYPGRSIDCNDFTQNFFAFCSVDHFEFWAFVDSGYPASIFSNRHFQKWRDVC